MSKPTVYPHSKCVVDGCTRPRHVTSGGAIRSRCTAHWKAYKGAINARAYARKRGLSTGDTQRIQGRPMPPTVIIDEDAGVVQQIVGNTIVRERDIPLRGLREETLLLLQHRGWQIKYGVLKVAVGQRETA
jgi:hypothetical protein